VQVGLLVLTASLVGRAQQAPARGGGAGGGGRGGQAGQPQGPPQVSRRPEVTPALVEQGKAIWTRECITCHGTNARGTETGPNLIRSQTIGYDRGVPALGLGTVLGPYLKKGHPTQSGKSSASFTDQETLALAHFLSDKVNETMRGSPTYVVLPKNLLTGDSEDGEAFFKGPGGCTQCHNATTRSLAGIATRIPNPQQLQSMVVYPGRAGGRGGGGGGGGRGGRGGGPGADAAAAEAAPAVNPLAIVTTVTPANGTPVSGTVVEEDSFFISLRDSTGTVRTFRKSPSMKITSVNPMQWHVEFADRITDKQMHDLTAYLWSLK